MCKLLFEGKSMATNLAINDELLASAVSVSGLKTKKETVNLALEEFIQKRRRKEAMELFGKIKFAKNWNPKNARGKI
jgi:Arc/MetJ family transcription regulator